MPEIRVATTRDHSEILSLLLESRSLYPGIDEWWLSKVLPDLDGGLRRAFVLDDGGSSLKGVAVVKAGDRAKLCSLRVRPGLQGNGWGVRMLRKAAAWAVQHSQQGALVTVSEAAQPGVREFFQRHGFVLSGWVRDKYVSGVDELVLTCSQYALARIAAMPTIHLETRATSGDSGTVPRTILMSVKPEYAAMILDGSKRVEFRRRFSKKYAGAMVLFYVSKPVSSVCLAAKIGEVDVADTEKLWQKYQDAGSVNRGVFDTYFAGKEEGYALELTDVRRVRNPVGIAEARKIDPSFLPPQSFRAIDEKDRLLSALGVHA